MYFKKPFQSKKGSLVLSIVASGAVAASIVASHQIAQNFSANAGQEGYQQAFVVAQKALAVASLLVSRSVVLCSQEHGCYLRQKRTNGEKFYNSFFFDDAGASRVHYKNDSFSQDDGSDVLTLKDVQQGPLRIVSRYDNGDNQGSIVWSLRNWHTDPSVRAVFNLNQQTIAPFYKCQNHDGSTNDKGVCSWDHRKSLSQVKETKVVCKDSSGNNLSDPVDPENNPPPTCAFMHDNDGEMVFISVTIPYQEFVTEDRSVGKKLILNGAIRRPMGSLPLYNHYTPICSLSCEAVEDLGLNDHPICAGLNSYTGLSDYGKKNLSDRARSSLYSNKALVARAQTGVTNLGSGAVFSNFELIREDSDAINSELLYKTSYRPLGFLYRGRYLRPGSVWAGSDYIPCYVSQYHPKSVKRLKGMNYGGLPSAQPAMALRGDTEAPDCGDVGHNSSASDFFTSCRKPSHTPSMPSEATLVSNRGVNIHGNVAIYSRYSSGRVDRPDYVCRKKGKRHDRSLNRDESTSEVVYLAYYCPPLNECEDDYPSNDNIQKCKCRNAENLKVEDTVCDYANIEPLRMDGLNVEMPVPAEGEIIHYNVGIDRTIPTVVIPK